ncbi:pyridoxamine 5'-phosphate oxidase family protein [[Eubacterium] hominis]|uniref:pyridoxamine 5'-phosphate oxidase family protein n=1 Tax=[Eubacterium] hominis TaxID=2764325 RepID=UPI003A4DEEB1
MQIDYNQAVLELEEYLNKNKTWVLSTSSNDYVTSRMMSIINQGVEIYFQTNHCYIKDEQMINNPNVSLCCGNYSIEGIAIPIVIGKR